ncbi:hypothetical protein FRC02_009010 [Tulasnella sp. 418]|nr:hypothetical protein FRC02_009010 [Tulasnella sp. 418]
MPENSTSTVPSALPAEKVTNTIATGFSHPLDPLSPQEIEEVSLAIRLHAVEHQFGIQAFKFVTSNIIAPPKRDVLAFLGIPITPGGQVEPSESKLLRRAESDFIDPVTG